MKISVAQTSPVKGDIQANISGHLGLIDLAAIHGAGVIIFPELSLTGYEPTLAKELAIDISDERLSVFRDASAKNDLIIGVGAPMRSERGITISMIIFQPTGELQIYSKKYLHADETAFFVCGENLRQSISNQLNIALSICYELSIPEHSAEATKRGAVVYISSSVKSESGTAKALNDLSNIAAKQSMTVLFSNCVGQCEDYRCGGQSSVWDNDGKKIDQLDDQHEGILVFDTITGEPTKFYLPVDSNKKVIEDL